MPFEGDDLVATRCVPNLGSPVGASGHNPLAIFAERLTVSVCPLRVSACWANRPTMRMRAAGACMLLCLQLLRDRLELLQRGLQVVGDLLGEHVRGGEVFRVFQALVFE